jgi:two-component system sensor histidine kinase HydH
MGARGTIRVSLERVGAYSRVTVADEGPGIPPEWRERIFEPFFTTRHRGTGLGLAIVKRDVEAHGGQVAVVCPPTGGTVVAVSLPVARS